MSIRVAVVVPLLFLVGCPEVPPDDDDASPVVDVDDDDAEEPPFDWGDDWRELTQGVSVLEGGGSLPSSLVVHGNTAFPVFLDENDRTFIAAGLYGAGRFLVVGHESYLHGHPTPGDDQDVLSANAPSWMAQSAPQNVTVGQLSGFDDLMDHYDEQGYTTTRSSVAELDGSDIDVWVQSSSQDLSDDDTEALRAFVEQGGGLIVGGQSWYWSYSNDNTAENYPANKYLSPMGVTYSSYTHVDGGHDELREPGPLHHARHALQAFLDHVDGTVELSLDDQRLGAKAAGLAIDVLPLSFTDYFGKAEALKAETGPIVITAELPLVRADRPIDEVVVTYDTKVAREQRPDLMEAHPATEDFPGTVPEDASTGEVTVSIDATHAGRHSDYVYSGAGAAAMRSTGVYAPPGRRIGVSVVSGWQNQDLEVQIGAHTDTMWGKDTWERYPDIVRRDPIDDVSVESASAFGGLVYIRVPVGSELGVEDVTISGGVPAPWYIHGETTNEQMVGMVDAAVAPWGELQTDSIILTVPTSQLVGLTNANELMDFWSDVQDANAALSGFGPVRERAERIVVDRQISAGFMHSGYPIMAHVPSGEEFMSLSGLQSGGNWGAFHELGHNYQWRDWILPGTTETTCNLFSVYVSEEVVGIDRGEAHSAISDESRVIRISDYLATGPDFGSWSVWTALETYLQLQEKFGWAPFTQVFTEQRALSDAESPGADQARIDFWVLGMSEATNRDLVPFFTAWGFPVSQSTIDATAGLDPWLDHPLAP
jgi:hypothetical protein